MNTLQFKQMMNLRNCLVSNFTNFFFICLWGGRFRTKLDGSRYWESLESTLLALMNDL